MKHARWLFLLLMVGAATLLSASDIQVTCEPGLKVYLDGAFVGTSNTSEDGLVLTGVPEGPHTIRVEKPGFMPQRLNVVVANEPVEIERVRKLSRSPSIPSI